MKAMRGSSTPLRFAELNVIRKSWSRVKVRVALCYPNVYRAGMTGLTVQQLYYLFNLHEEVLCERCFLGGGEPRTVESYADLRSFDVLAFTMQYEEDYVNMLRMLMRAGINPLKSERRESDPIVIAGGQAVSANPTLISAFADAVFIGELEPKLPELLDSLMDGRSKAEKLLSLSDIDCVYVEGKDYVKRSTAVNLDDTPHIVAQVTPTDRSEVLDPIFADALYVEVSRSCGRRCRFCLLAWTNGPFRYRSYDRFIELLEEGLKRSSASKVVFIGANVFDVPRLKDMCRDVLNRGLSLSIPSLRPDAVDHELLELIKRGGQRSLALGFESTSYNLRRFLGKSYPDEVIEESFELASKYGIRDIKAYLIVGLPGESPADVEACGDTFRRLASKYNVNVHVSINPLIPKPNTPLQWLPPLKPAQVREIYRAYLKALRHRRVKVDTLKPHRAYVQSMLSLADVTMAPKLLQLAMMDHATWSLMSRELEKVFCNPREENPWDVVDLGFPRDELKRQFKMALEVVGASEQLARWL